MIEYADLVKMFDNIRHDTAWNIDGPMLWGYFFTDQSPDKLRELSAHLQSTGYRFVDLFIPELDDGEDEYYFLHVERVESHTVESLHERNQELESLAQQMGVRSYDGMDVGPATSA